MLYAQGETLVFVRTYQREQVLVALQRSGSGEVELPYSPLLREGKWQLVEGEGERVAQEGGLRLQLVAESASVWRLRG
ncbi:Maltodextrin glucosidase [compost metagenome]